VTPSRQPDAHSPAAALESAPPRVPFRAALRVWTFVGLNSFGGPAGQIAVMHRVLVDEKRWIGEERFLHALNYCMLLPGPEAQQLSVYIGWLLNGTAGGLAAGILFVLPGFVAMLGLSALYAGWHDVAAVGAIFYGIKPAVLAIVVDALVRIGKRALKSRASIVLAAASFVALTLFDVPFPLVVLAAALFGYAVARFTSGALEPADAAHGVSPARPSKMRTLRVLCVGLAAWFLPLFAVGALFGVQSVFFEEGMFFSKTAVVTFGGAYAVLTYVKQQAVSVHGWLAPREMLDGLGLAETTPGPLILVLQFVGFLGAYRAAGTMSPMLAGVIGACVTVWATFAPCFLWVFLGAPYVESLRGRRALAAALSSITAVIVGVILNLAVWFAVHTLFGEVDERHAGALRYLAPHFDTLDVAALVIAVAAMIATFRYRVGMMWLIAGAALAGLAWKSIAG
jgi:chromate transporter